MSHVDWDLLADHLGGALTGTPEEVRVARLVATDPGWARAAAELADAVAAVAADLQTVPPAPAMPDDVAARLEASLRGFPGSALRTAAAPRPGVPAGSGSPPPSAPAGAGASHPAGRRPGDRRRRRRLAQWGAGLAVAAGVAGFAALALGPLGLSGDDMLGSDDSGGAAAPNAAADRGSAEEFSAEPGIPPMSASGLDYRPGSPLFRGGPMAAAPGPVDEGSGPQEDGGSDSSRDAVPEELTRLVDDPQPCLSAVLASFDPTPARVAKMDFALFEGEPSVVIWVTTDGEGEWVTVSGPECGTPAAGPDERYRTRIG